MNGVTPLVPAPLAAPARPAQDIVQALANYRERGIALAARIRETHAVLTSLRPDMTFLAHSPDVPEQVRIAAGLHSDALERFLDRLTAVTAQLFSWRIDVANALRSINGQDGQGDGRAAAGAGELAQPVNLDAIHAVLGQIDRPWLWGDGAAEPMRNFLLGAEQFLPRADDSLCPNGSDASHWGAGPGNGHNGYNGGAMAAAGGVPQGVESYRTAYYASWETQARLFAYGVPIAYNVHHRRYTFADKSYVDIQAYQPELQTSPSSDLAVVLAGVLGAATGSFVGAAGGGLLGVVVGAALGGFSGFTWSAAQRPYDVTWQGYRASYYSAQGEQIWGTRYFYGSKQSTSVMHAVTVGGAQDPAAFYNFADHHTEFSWSRWRHGAASERPAAFGDCNIDPTRAASRLVQDAAALAPEQGSGAAASASQPAQLTPAPWLLSSIQSA